MYQRQDTSNLDLTRSMVCTTCSKSVTLCTHAHQAGLQMWDYSQCIQNLECKRIVGDTGICFISNKQLSLVSVYYDYSYEWCSVLTCWTRLVWSMALVLDISQRMLYNKHSYMSQIYPLSVMSTVMITTDTFVPTYPWGFFQSRMETQHI